MIFPRFSLVFTSAISLSFLGESDELEDDLFDLMQPETLFQYGSKAHALRVKANELVVGINISVNAF